MRRPSVATFAGVLILFSGFVISDCGDPRKDPVAISQETFCNGSNLTTEDQFSCKVWKEELANRVANYENFLASPDQISLYLLTLLAGGKPKPKVVPHALAAPPCYPILFSQALTQVAADFETASSGPSTIYTLATYRQSDGNFTGQGFSFLSGNPQPAGTYLGSLPQAQSYFLTCTTLGPWTPAPHATLLADLPGTMSRVGLTTSLGGSSIASVQVNPASNTITVLLDSQTTFGSSYTDYPVGPSPISVVTGDFNGDGKRDLAVLGNGSPTGNGGSVSILPGNGNGTLGSAKFYNVGAGPAAMTAFDFNKDGRTDLAVVNTSDNTVSVLLANPDGSLRSAVTYPLIGQLFVAQPSAIVAADFDGDGKTDLMVYGGDNVGFELLRGNGDGTFQGAAQKAGYVNETNLVVAFSSLYLAAGDFNKDGKIDLASFNSDATVTILLNSGDGSFPNSNRYVAGTPVTTGAYGPGMFVMDFNDDGNLDLVFAQGHPDALFPDPSFITVLPGNGDGTFQAAAPAFPTGNIPDAMAMADFNGDGRRDLVVAGGQTLAILLGTSAGGFRPGTPVQMPAFDPAQWVAVADLNNDGIADLIAVDNPYNKPGHVYTWLGKGDGTFQAPSTYTVGVGPNFVAAGDLNGDGVTDLVVSFGDTGATTIPGTSISVLLGKAGGGFNSPISVSTGPNTVRLALADVNSDGKPDLIAVNLGVADTGYGGATPSAGNVTVSLGKGDGTFQSPVAYTVSVNPISVTVADVNGDGKPDLVVGTASDTAANIGILLGNGNGTFGAAGLVTTYAWPSAVMTADFDGDGKLDLAIVHIAADPPVTVMRGNGDGTFQDELHLLAGDGPVAAIASDFTGKGRSDVAVLNQAYLGNGTVNLFRNLSPSAPACTYSLGASSQAIAAAGGSGSFPLTAGSGCNWSALSGANWVRVTSDEFGVSSGNVSFTVTANTGAARSTTITAGGRTFTINQAAGGSLGTSQPVSVNPAAGSASPQTFTFTFSDPNGWQDLDVVNVLIGRFLDGRNNCYLAYSNSGGVLYLVNDPGTALLAGVVAAAGGATANSQCGVSLTSSSVSGSGNTLTLSLSMTFSAAFAGNKVIYMAARDLHGGNSGWQALGTWNAPGPTPSGPSVGGVTPAHTAGSGAVTYTFTFNDSNGYQDLGVVNVLINDALNGNNACYIAYSRAGNVLYLVNDAGTALSSGLVLTGSGGAGNSQCTVSGSGTSATGSGNTLTLTLNVTFASSFAGNRIIYAAARSNGDVLNSDWQAVGSRTVQ